MVSTTTFEAIRQHQIATLQGLTPLIAEDVRFQAEPAYTGFQRWAEENAERCLRRFTIRLTAREQGLIDLVEFATDQARLLIAYPSQPLGEYGAEDWLDLDALLASDYEQIRKAISSVNRSTWATGQMSCRAEGCEVIHGTNVTFLSIPLTVSYYIGRPAARLYGGALTMAGTAALTAASSAQYGGSVAMAGSGAMTATGAVQDSVDSDGPGPYYVPSTSAQWTALGITAPRSWWLCQESSGNLDDAQTASTDFDLTANNSPSYQNTRTGWAGKFVGTTDGTAAQRFIVNDTATWNPQSTSLAFLLYAEIASATANRTFISGGDGSAATGPIVRANSAGTIAIVINGVTTNGTYTYEADGLTHPFLFVYDRTNSLIRVYTDQEQINGTYSTNVGNSVAKGPLSCVNGTIPTVYGRFMAGWLGADAEALSKTTLTALGWTLAY